MTHMLSFLCLVCRLTGHRATMPALRCWVVNSTNVRYSILSSRGKSQPLLSLPRTKAKRHGEIYMHLVPIFDAHGLPQSSYRAAIPGPGPPAPLAVMPSYATAPAFRDRMINLIRSWAAQYSTIFAPLFCLLGLRHSESPPISLQFALRGPSVGNKASKIQANLVNFPHWPMAGCIKELLQ